MTRGSAPRRHALVLLAALAAGAGASGDAVFDGGEGLRPPRPGDEAPARVWATFAAPDRAARTALASAGVSIDEIRPGTAAGVATRAALARATSAGLKLLSAQALPDGARALDFPPQDAAFHDSARTAAALKEIAAKAPDLASLIEIGRSVQGKPIMGVRLCPDAKGAEPSRLPGAVFMGNHHAREHLSNEVPLLLLKRLVENRNEPEVAALLNSRDIYFFPMINPDGADYDVAEGRYRWHRKNMQRNPDGSTGVDLNRNYGVDWGGAGASPDPDSDTYRGPAAFSEPESRAVRDFARGRKNLTTLVSYHSFSELILYPWSGRDEEIADGEALKAYKAAAAELGKMTGYRPMQSSAFYASTGDTADWSWGELGLFSWTFELTPRSSWEGGFYPGAAAIASAVQNNWRPLLYLLDLADDPRRAARSSQHSAFAFADAAQETKK